MLLPGCLFFFLLRFPFLPPLWVRMYCSGLAWVARSRASIVGEMNGCGSGVSSVELWKGEGCGRLGGEASDGWVDGGRSWGIW